MSRTVATCLARRAFVAVAVLAIIAPASASATGRADTASPATTPAADVDRPGRLTRFRAPDVEPAAPSGRIIVRFRPGASKASRTGVRLAAGAAFDRELSLIDAHVVTPRGRSFEATLAALRRDPNVLSAEPSRPLSLHVDPTDEPFYYAQWGHENTGLEIPWPGGTPGITDIDVDGTAALAQADGSGVVVAVIDDGLDVTHPDLQGQVWTNPGESGGGKETNGLDDDSNGYVDDVNGWDFCNDDNTLHDAMSPTLPDYHGTAVAGTIAAAVNGVGSAGIAPGAQIMGLKFLVQNGICPETTFAIEAIEYAVANGADIINASWGGPGTDPILDDAIEAAGILFVASAGNGGPDGVGDNIDVHPVNPGASTVANVLSVAANDNRGRLTSFSNYGPTTVDITAPGKDVVVPIPLDALDGDGWYYFDGTSFSAPYAAGVAALVLSENPGLTATQLRTRLMNSGTLLSSTTGKTVSGRHLNARNALDVVPPVFHGGSATPAAGKTMAISSVLVRAAWAPATDNAGISYYAVRFRQVGGAWTTLVSRTLQRYIDRALPFGKSYEFEIRARDVGGNVTTMIIPLKLYRYQETATQATYTARWANASISTASGGQTKYAVRAGQSVTLAFYGKSIGFVAPLGLTRGLAKLYVDGTFVKTINLYSSSLVARRVVYSRAWAGNGNHTLKLVVNGTGSHPRIDVDAFVFSR